MKFNKPTFKHLLQSILGALLGVQSNKTCKRDFTQGKWWVYIISGIVTAILFVVVVLAISRWAVVNFA